MEQELLNLMEELKKKERTLPREPESYHCSICKDQGYIYKIDGLYEIAIKCKCQTLKEAKQRLEKSGLGDLLESKTLDNYTTTNEYQKHIKETAVKYLNEYGKGNKYSLALLGQSGVGKTHIMSAVSRELLDAGVEVKYYIADDIIQRLQSNKYDEQNYQLEFGKIVKAEILYIDDLFKSSITNYYKQENIKIADLKVIFEIINYRYNKKMPILLNSEIHFERFSDIDQAIIGRINEMCNYKYLVSIKPDINKNYRLIKR
jgi:DNA replication protein DnaC